LALDQLQMLEKIDAGSLRIAYKDLGPRENTAVVLLHGFPYDIHAFDEVAPILVNSSCRVIRPYLRGFGPTAFLSPQDVRSGQQAALGQDVISLLDALGIHRAVLAGYDWGGRAACVAAALWPHRVSGLISVGGYNIQDISTACVPQPPELEMRYWYQYYFHLDRGKEGLKQYRKRLCKLLWELWSPTWNFDEKTFEQTAVSFDNPDFVDVVIHSYRHRFGMIAGDPQLEDLEEKLAKQPAIYAPTVILDGANDGVLPPVNTSNDHRFFKGGYERKTIPNVGHNLPQEAPNEFAKAVLSLLPVAMIP
jgi:pimeloyl-ACP methyl ester carboxylesterase